MKAVLRAADDAMDTPDAATSRAPLHGRLVPLRTRDEVRASLETLSAYVVEIPARYANAVKDVIQEALPDFKTADISHLRRVVQFKYLPFHLQRHYYPPARLPRGDQDTSPVSLSPPSTPLLPSPSGEEATKVVDEVSAEELDAVRFFLLCPTKYIQHAELFSLLGRNEPFKTYSTPPRILYVTVPALAPTSSEQAARWSEQYWPIAYKNTNPYGPHPSLVARNAAEIEPETRKWLALAASAGRLTADMDLGEKVGCVVVDRSCGTSDVVAVAGDCRWRSPTGTAEAHSHPGNAMAHAVHRAIAMVAKKRLRASGTDPTILDRPLFCDTPLTDPERTYYAIDNIGASGYLCVDLDIYLTHEPCVMCSMAILHSRFKRCVMGKRMPLTGGLTSETAMVHGAEAGLKHGIFWRPSELNWKYLAWEWEEQANNAEEKDPVTSSVEDTLHA